MKFDWFWFGLSLAYLLMGILFFIKEYDWFIILINFLLGIAFMYKSWTSVRRIK